MDEFLKLAFQQSGAALMGLIAFYYGNKSLAMFMDTINNHLKESNAAQREEARAKEKLAIQLQALTISHTEQKNITEKLYLELLKNKNPDLFKRIQQQQQ